MTEPELIDYLKIRLLEIRATAGIPQKRTGKMAYITTLSGECIDAIHEQEAG